MICYPYAEIVPDDYGEDSIQYRRGNRSPKSGVWEWPVVRLWHGMAIENLAQGIAFDLLMGALRRLHHSKWAVRMHVHDEIVPEVNVEFAETLLKKFLDIMTRGEEWSEGFPIAAEGKISERYVK
jgi:DNA polymerase